MTGYHEAVLYQSKRRRRRERIRVVIYAAAAGICLTVAGVKIALLIWGN